jgi:hypothetical protein
MSAYAGDGLLPIPVFEFAPQIDAETLSQRFNGEPHTIKPAKLALLRCGSRQIGRKPISA